MAGNLKIPICYNFYKIKRLIKNLDQAIILKLLVAYSRVIKILVDNYGLQ